MTLSERGVFLCLLVSPLLAARAPAAEKLNVTAEEMKVALRTERVEEDGFIDDVVDRVTNPGRRSDEQLPASMVEGTFEWARRKRRHRFQYFRRGLTLRAARIGVRL
ncbi:MAG: hypothetical protein ACOC46_03290 [Pirellulales bacterium]